MLYALAARPTRVLKGAVAAVLVAVSIGLYHVLILGQQYESPLPVVLLVTTILILLALLSGLNRATGGRAARRPGSWCRPALAVFFALSVVVFHQAFDRAASDGRGYFVQTRSLVIDGDLDIAAEIQSFGALNGAEYYQVGTAFLWVPFFAAGHAYLAILNGFGHDFDLTGYANPYQRAVALGTLVYGLLALALIYDLVRRWFSEQTALATVVLLSAGTFVGWYLVRESTMSHDVSMFTTTLFLYVWIRTLGHNTALRWAGLGALAGLMILVRYQNAAFMVAPLLETMVEHARAAGIRDRQRFLAATGRGALFLVGLAVGLIPLLAAQGSGLPGVVETAAAHEVQWASPAGIDGLFSPVNGLLSWTPLLYLGVLGLPLIVRRFPMVGGVLLLVFVAQVWINGMVPGGGGAGFGARRFANCALVFAVGMAAALHWLKAHPRLTVGTVLSLLVGWNLILMGEKVAGRFPGGSGVPFDAMVEAAYRRTGNPFSLPRSLYFGWTHGVSPRLYDTLSLRSYSNLSIDFGNTDDHSFLNGGWSGQEREASGVTFRWAEGRSAHLVVPLRVGSSYRLVVDGAPFQFPDSPPQTLAVRVNDVTVGRVFMGGGSQEYAFEAPAELIPDRIVHVTFRFGYARSPASLGISDDRRELAVRFEHLRMHMVE